MEDPTSAGRSPAAGASPSPVKKQAVKRHHHKHNLKHRYEFLETLGKGTYGKVKKAKERCGRLVRSSDLMMGLGSSRSAGHCLFCGANGHLSATDSGLFLEDTQSAIRQSTS